MSMKSLVLAIVGAAIFFCGVSVYAAQTFTMQQDKPKLTIVDIGEKGASHGDIIAFEATLTVDNGTKGEIRGTVTIVDVPTGANDPHYDAVENILLDFGGEDTLVAIGKSRWAGSAAVVTTTAPVASVRAIVGGTGRYIGARGQITSIGRDNGRYEHVVILVD
jgi:hypothetical protein